MPEKKLTTREKVLRSREFGSCATPMYSTDDPAFYGASFGASIRDTGRGLNTSTDSNKNNKGKGDV